MKKYLNRVNLQITAWLTLIIIMLAGGYYQLYLVEWQFYTLFFTLAVLALVLILGKGGKTSTCECLHEHAHGPQKPSIMETVLHFVPLFLFLSVGPTTLGSSTANTGDPLATLSQPARDTEITAEKTDDGYFQVTILDLYRVKAFRDEPRPVQLTGMVYHLTREEEKSLPFGVKPEDVRIMLFRYAIWCCVADARQVTVVLSGKDLGGFETGRWLEIKGTARPPEGNLPLFTIEVEKARPVSRPENPYVY